jgi:hypothetical protein
MSQQYKAVAEILKGAMASINVILVGSEDEMHRVKLTQTLQREADYILLVTGAGDITDNAGPVLGPATTIGGKPISKLPRITERDLRPSDDAVLSLKEQVEDALHYFSPGGSSAGILANMPDLVVRGVAKKAGLKVTKDQPKELTVEFIDEIKAALLEKGLTKHAEPAGPLTEEDISLVAEKIEEATEEVNKKKAQTEEVATDEEAAEFGKNAAKDLYDMIKDVKPGQTDQPKIEEPKSEESKPDPKKKAGK